METEAALRIWKRTNSYETPLQFTTFLSDGDSEAYTAVSELDIYGGVLPVQKEECTNHVAKRLGTALGKLKMPRGEKLNDATIRKLQGYFQVATTSNRGSVRDMCSLGIVLSFLLEGRCLQSQVLPRWRHVLVKAQAGTGTSQHHLTLPY
ncbi:hypothetical protein HPB50_013566 [Hyalomma asiaticum]|uniref:Uncharacterized protein n=1 Tax=Hyalomma asiaticum TaxID=266040 RepID=A0ACB7SVV2_HYAAI|nr:hypothetical protein HPB50_013566 [Hyalomma asiaticum]